MDQPPLSFIPTPSASYRQHRKAAALVLEPGPPRIGLGSEPVSAYGSGVRVLMWKQDPSVHEIGTRKVFLPGLVLDGPRDARIALVSPNAFGDFVCMPETPQFDAVHTYTVVRQTLTMYQRAQDTPLPWQWNSSADLAPITVFPHGLPNVMNAFYSRAQHCLKFGDFIPAGNSARVYTCRSFDIVAHETGHAVLDGLKPAWLLAARLAEADGQPQPYRDAIRNRFVEREVVLSSVAPDADHPPGVALAQWCAAHGRDGTPTPGAGAGSDTI